MDSPKTNIPNTAHTRTNTKDVAVLLRINLIVPTTTTECRLVAHHLGLNALRLRL